MTAEIGIALALGLAATVEDLWRRTISNWIPIAALAGGFACQISAKGLAGLGAGALGALSGFAVFLLFYLLGGMGGGDVKLMAGFGALLGAGRLLEAALWTAGVGGVIALLVIAVAWLRSLGQPADSPKRAPRAIPYAPAIALGVWLALIPKGS